MVEKVKPMRLSSFERGLWYQNHAKMNAHILGNAMVVQRQNDQKVASRCNMTNGERWRFTRDDLIHPLCICTTIEDGMGC
jgi:hypothetical protein